MPRLSCFELLLDRIFFVNFFFISFLHLFSSLVLLVGFRLNIFTCISLFFLRLYSLGLCVSMDSFLSSNKIILLSFSCSPSLCIQTLSLSWATWLFYFFQKKPKKYVFFLFSACVKLNLVVSFGLPSSSFAFICLVFLTLYNDSIYFQEFFLNWCSCLSNCLVRLF